MVEGVIVTPLRQVLNERENVISMRNLMEAIGCGIHDKPNHLLPRYASLDCRNADLLYGGLLTLPCYADMDAPEVQPVIEQVTGSFR